MCQEAFTLKQNTEKTILVIPLYFFQAKYFQPPIREVCHSHPVQNIPILYKIATFGLFLKRPNVYFSYQGTTSKVLVISLPTTIAQNCSVQPCCVTITLIV